MCYNTDYRGSRAHARACQQKDALDGPFVLLREEKEARAGVWDGGEFFFFSLTETRYAKTSPP